MDIKNGVSNIKLLIDFLLNTELSKVNEINKSCDNVVFIKQWSDCSRGLYYNSECLISLLTLGNKTETHSLYFHSDHMVIFNSNSTGYYYDINGGDENIYYPGGKTRWSNVRLIEFPSTEEDMNSKLFQLSTAGIDDGTLLSLEVGWHLYQYNYGYELRVNKISSHINCSYGHILDIINGMK